LSGNCNTQNEAHFVASNITFFFLNAEIVVALINISHPFLRNTYNCSFAVFVRLFAKLSRPGDSEVTFAVFESSCHLLLPV